MQLLPAVRISGQKKGEKFMMTAFETIQAETVPTDNENNFPAEGRPQEGLNGKSQSTEAFIKSVR